MNTSNYAPNPEDLPPGRRPVQQFGFPVMSLRDYLAAKAMQGFLSNSDLSERWRSISDSVAAEAYATADAMLAERAKP